MLQQNLEFTCWMRRSRSVEDRGPSRALASHKSTKANGSGFPPGQPREYRRIPIRLRFRADSRQQLGETGMLADPAKPALRVAVIWFPSVHDGVDIAAVGVLDALRDLMRRSR
jgi:hypothetical protein